MGTAEDALDAPTARGGLVDREAVAAPSVMAIVVTYMAPQNLGRCLAAITAQVRPVDALLIVDNGASLAAHPEANENAQRGSPMIIAPGENLGPAGGFARGLSHFLETDHDFAWVMDDDIEPMPDCLAALLEASDARAWSVLVGPILFERSTEDRKSIWGWHGTLLPRGYVERAGVPRSDLFWGLEDTEYLHYRPPSHGYHAILHDGARALITTRRPDASVASWKYFYLGRNAVFLNLYQRPGVSRSSRLKRLTRHLWDLELMAARDPRSRWRKGFLVARGGYDGVRKRLGRTITPTDPDRPFG